MLEDVHQLVHCLRHWDIDNLHHGSDVGKLLHGCTGGPILAALAAHQTGWPPPAGLFVVQREELRLGRRGLLSPWRVVLVLVLLLPGPGRLLALCAVVHKRGQAAAIACWTCRHHERSRRCLRRWAAPVTVCQLRL